MTLEELLTFSDLHLLRVFQFLLHNCLARTEDEKTHARGPGGLKAHSDTAASWQSHSQAGLEKKESRIQVPILFSLPSLTLLLTSEVKDGSGQRRNVPLTRVHRASVRRPRASLQQP